MEKQLAHYIDSLGAALVIYADKEEVVKRYIELKAQIHEDVNKDEQNEAIHTLEQAFEIVTSSYLS